MTSAMKSVLEHNESVSSVSKKFKVLRHTLEDGCVLHGTNLGRKTVLTKEEDGLVSYG